MQNDASFGVQTNQFGFDVIGDDWTFVVEACTNLANPTWSPVATNTVAGTISGFNMAAGGCLLFQRPAVDKLSRTLLSPHHAVTQTTSMRLPTPLK